jgi:hypothetical protein
VSHTLFRHAKQFRAIRTKLDALDSSREFPSLEKATSLDLPESDSVVGAAGCDHGACRIAVDGPNGTDVALVGSKALTIVRKPHTNLLILGYGKEKVAVRVVSGIWSARRGGHGGVVSGCRILDLGQSPFLRGVSKDFQVEGAIKQRHTWPERRIGLIFAVGLCSCVGGY